MSVLGVGVVDRAYEPCWRKLHLAVNPKSHEIISASLTTNDIHDSQVFPELLNTHHPVEVVYADGAYDASSCYDHLAEIGAQGIIPPRKGAKIQQYGNSKNLPLPRDENIRGVRKLGRKGWKVQSSYHTRSLAETAMYRIKQIFGGNLKSRSFGQQATEAFQIEGIDFDVNARHAGQRSDNNLESSGRGAVCLDTSSNYLHATTPLKIVLKYDLLRRESQSNCRL